VTGTLNKNLCLFVIISGSALLRMGHFYTKSVQKIKTRILCLIIFFPENHAVYEIMGKNIVELDRQHMTIWRMRIACCIPKATNTHSVYVIFTIFLLQKLLHERA
jgi:hypothetical protein